jgi:hypothetical protein
MKSKTTATTALEIIQPKQIINRHLRPAIAPFKAELLAAAEVDRKLSEQMESKHPNLAKAEALQLLEKAGAGDLEADKILTEAGGTEAYVKSRTALFDLSRAKHEAACIASVPLWTKVSAAILAAIDASDREIQSQWQKVCDYLGEPCDLSRWNQYCRNLRSGVERTPFAAEKMRHGSSWQLESLGLRELLD